jgi:hypothetical protein
MKFTGLSDKNSVTYYVNVIDKRWGYRIKGFLAGVVCALTFWIVSLLASVQVSP